MNDYHKVGEADYAQVKRIIEAMMRGLNEFLQGEAEPPTIRDMFMAAHNFHKAVIFRAVEQAELTGEQRHAVLMSVAATFERAMEAGL